MDQVAYEILSQILAVCEGQEVYVIDDDHYLEFLSGEDTGHDAEALVIEVVKGKKTVSRWAIRATKLS